MRGHYDFSKGKKNPYVSRLNRPDADHLFEMAVVRQVTGRLESNRVCDTRRFGCPQIRVYHRRGRGKQSPSLLFRCGCCAERVEVFYGLDGLEINGVHGAIEDWRELLGPLLGWRGWGNRQSALRKRRPSRSGLRRSGSE